MLFTPITAEETHLYNVLRQASASGMPDHHNTTSSMLSLLRRYDHITSHPPQPSKDTSTYHKNSYSPRLSSQVAHHSHNSYSYALQTSPTLQNSKPHRSLVRALRCGFRRACSCRVAPCCAVDIMSACVICGVRGRAGLACAA